MTRALEVLGEVQRQAESIGGASLVVVLSNIGEAYLKKGNTINALIYNQRALVEIRTKHFGQYAPFFEPLQFRHDIRAIRPV